MGLADMAGISVERSSHKHFSGDFSRDIPRVCLEGTISEIRAVVGMRCAPHQIARHNSKSIGIPYYDILGVRNKKMGRIEKPAPV